MFLLPAAALTDWFWSSGEGLSWLVVVQVLVFVWVQRVQVQQQMMVFGPHLPERLILQTKTSACWITEDGFRTFSLTVFCCVGTGLWTADCGHGQMWTCWTPCGNLISSAVFWPSRFAKNCEVLVGVWSFSCSHRSRKWLRAERERVDCWTLTSGFVSVDLTFSL